jgi:uncharacterized cupredoxin-like copper-binding protein
MSEPRPMARRGRRRLSIATAAVLVAAASVGVVACGGDDDEETTPAETTTAPAGGGGGGEQTLKVSETEYKLDPSDPTVKPGTVTFEVSNDGQVVHNLEVEGPSGEAELEQDLQAGQSAELTVDLNQPGKYEWYCPVGNHRELGMEGTITVKG